MFTRTRFSASFGGHSARHAMCMCPIADLAARRVVIERMTVQLQARQFFLLGMLLASAAVSACADPLAFDGESARPSRPSLGAGAGQAAPEAPPAGASPAFALPRPAIPFDTSVSPLCAIAPHECDPDDATGGRCAADGAEGVVAPRQACRIRLTLRDHSGAPVLACVPAGSRGDGGSCRTSAQCAPGYDCVGSPGVCRHYCCERNNSPCGEGYFCDVQPAADFASLSLTVPVCSPVRDCRLLGSHLGPNACAANETCTVVDSRGETSCVLTGLAGAGQSCEASNCAANHVCVGHAGYRKCYALCDASIPSSAPCSGQGETCEPNPALFKSSNVGTCIGGSAE